MNIIQVGLTLGLASALISSATAEWTERREGNVVIIGPAPPVPAKEAERLARERQKRAEEEQRRKQNAAAAQAHEYADD